LKQLLPLADRPAIGHCVEGISSSGITDLVVVVGQGSDEVTAALQGLPVKIAVNRNLHSEMAESVRVGLRRIDPASTGVMVCLCDHPLISADTFRSIASVHLAEPEKILIPLYKGARGHPTLFPARLIRRVHEGMNLRQIITGADGNVRHIPVSDEGVVLDMDTMEDYRLVLEKMGGDAL